MKETLKKLRDTLVPIYGKGEAEAIIRIIFHHLKGWSLTDMLIHSDETLSPFIQEEIEKILNSLKEGKPIQYITGEARFHGMTMKVNPYVLIPRPETDELVYIIIDENKDREDLKVLDLCTGSGCIAIALARNLRFPSVSATDISEGAIECAKENSISLKAKVDFKIEDIFNSSPDGQFDIIVSNPPYIDESEAEQMERNVLDYEPHSALFVPDSDPLKFYKRIIEIARNHLKTGGKLYLEINPRHSDELKNLLLATGFSEVKVIIDSYGKKRFITCSL